MAQQWSPEDLRQLIQMEVTTGTTMQILNQCINNGALTDSIRAIATAANAHVVSLTSQAETNAREIDRVLTDCRTFVEETQKDSTEQKEILKAEPISMRHGHYLRLRDALEKLSK